MTWRGLSGGEDVAGVAVGSTLIFFPSLFILNWVNFEWFTVVPMTVGVGPNLDEFMDVQPFFQGFVNRTKPNSAYPDFSLVSQAVVLIFIFIFVFYPRKYPIKSYWLSRLDNIRLFQMADSET